MYLLIIIIIIILFFIQKCVIIKSNFDNKCNDYIIAIFLTSDYCEEAENLIKTLDNNNLKDKLIAYTLDKKSKKCMNKLGVKNTFKNMKLGNSSYGEELFYKIVTEKLVMIYELLIKQPKNILYMDTDIYVFKNFDEEMKQICQSKYDIIFQCDEFRPIHNKICENLCTGFFYVKNNSKTKKFFKDSIKRMKKGEYIKGRPADQRIINESLKDYPELNVTTFDQTQFPNGSIFFTHNIKENPFIVHNNYIKGLDNKINRFKMNNLWIV